MNSIINYNKGIRKHKIFTLLFLLYSFFTFAQVVSSVDYTLIKIGEQITYKIQVETDSTQLVIFPEGQTFQPLEVIDSYKIDTTRKDARYNLIKKYGLTQFDSGAYTIPRQRIVIGDKTFFTDSIKVEVKDILIDTTKQGLYDIKPIISVDKSAGNWWKYLIITLLVIGIISFLLYWFIWRKKPLTEEQKIALLPPYKRAKLALKNLENSDYLEQSELKAYYSELTLIIRKYLDEKVYDHALESTTDELISRLNLLKEGNQLDISNETIKNIESIFKRADLVKFARSNPDIALAELDRNTIDNEIDHVREILPEPTEEEKLLDQQYKEAQERKKKRKKIIITSAICVLLVIATLAAFSVKYGFTYVKDTILGHESKELLEGDWVTSDYGFPPITISTPKVLKRNKPEILEGAQAQMSITDFQYGTLLDGFSIQLSTLVLNQHESKEAIDLVESAEKAIQQMEAKGIQDIIVKNDKFVTPNNAEGLKTYGLASFPIIDSDEFYEGEYVILQFSTQNVLQTISITWEKDDVYAQEMVERIINSVELVKEGTPKEKQE